MTAGSPSRGDVCCSGGRFASRPAFPTARTGDLSKPRICHITAATLIALGVGCGQPGTDATTDGTVETAADAPRLADAVATAPEDEDGIFSEIREPWTGDFEEMAERRLIRVAVAHSRTLFFLDGAQPRGMTYDALTLFERFVNERLGTGTLKVYVTIDPRSRDDLFAAVAEGRADIAAANLTVTPERLELVDFSTPLIDGVHEVVVTGPSGGDPQAVQDLAGSEIHVRASSSYRESLDALNDRLTTAGLEPVRIVFADERLEDEDILELVNAGVYPATVVDSHIASLWAQILDDLRVHEDVYVRSDGAIAWAFRKDSPGLEAVVNEFARTHRAGTLVGNVTLKRYLENIEYLVHPHSGEGEARFERVRPAFERYAEEYGFDPLLLLAQAYQESRLDHSVRSRVGAVGVMQLLPSTAADPNVGFSDISSLDDNVHAGAKYLRFIVDRYFSEPTVSPVDRHLLAFAAYNAGPGRISRLRAEAEQEGLDPDIWFENVERIAARRVGREPVQYVSNIFKYYMAYRTAADTVGSAARD